MPYFIDVILPLPIPKLFAYQINEKEFNFIKPGMRVVVPFGKTKLYTAIVHRSHTDNNQTYEVKEIESIVDNDPIVTELQLRLWKWVASYYMSSLGEVMRSALPKSFLLESETIISLKEYDSEQTDLTDQEYLVIEALQSSSSLKITDIMAVLDRKTVLPILRGLLEKDIITLQEEVYSTYSPKTKTYLGIAQRYKNEDDLKLALEGLQRAKKQRETLLSLFMITAGNDKLVTYADLQERANVSRGVIKALVDKGIIEEITGQIDRVLDQEEQGEHIHKLSEPQKNAYHEIKEHFNEKEVCLLKGVTSSGKTELYIKFIKEELTAGNQSLFLLPEIALTTQLISRLKKHFKHQVLIYHSRYTLNERLEVWNHVLNAKEPYVIIGARSAVLLPFKKLSFIVVDEEHETSYKQFDPSPRYHARDLAIVLGGMTKAKVLLGSATPSIESFYNASTGKYGLVELKKRHRNILMPDINLVNLKESHRKKKMKGHFSTTLIEAMEVAFKENKQVILFQNRRGYAPILECNTCGHSPQCPNCDVSLTYHKYKNQLRCHYCGFHAVIPIHCISCESSDMDTKGLGTEQIELEFKELFPNQKIARMDLDTTRGKHSYEEIIEQMDTGKIDCLVGTQMLTKGLDFRNVILVGVMNADSILNFPDFRAHERCYQLLVQVSGRGGRTDERGKVLIQTYQPEHQILQQVSTYNYSRMYQEQLLDRKQFHYPPYYRVIRLTFKHRDYETTRIAGQWFVDALQQIKLEAEILGPVFPPVSRIRNKYIVNVMLKLGKNSNLTRVKTNVNRVNKSFEAVKTFRSVRLNIDVDAY